ncbi:MAG: hypothetical protein DRP88_08250 [Candidatus Neomarinimicrobiota bacterium]|nr:MAG: hypothetical protein DRP88_08250 [Candidatus Neomarinimicrobiota bacterium]
MKIFKESQTKYQGALFRCAHGLGGVSTAFLSFPLFRSAEADKGVGGNGAFLRQAERANKSTSK